MSGLILAGVKLVLLGFQGTLPTEVLATLTDCALTAVITVAAWLAARRSSAYARALWQCVTLAAILWTIQFAVGVIVLMFGSLTNPLSAVWPALVITSFPFAIALTLPLLLNDERERPGIGWLQALDIAQFGIIAFSVFFVFFYVPSLHIHSDEQRLRLLTVVHLMRDTFLALGYLYRGWRSKSRNHRWLYLRMSGFLAAYALPSILRFQLHNVWHWPMLFMSFLGDLPPLILLATAVTWRQPETVRPVEQTEAHKGILWTQLLPLIMPISVVALASRMPSSYMRAAWIAVTASFVCYALRLVLMQRRQNQTLSSLAALEETFAKAFKSSPAVITISRLGDGKFIDVNDRCLELMKMTREQVIGKTSLELGMFVNAEDRPKLVEALQKQGSVRGMKLNFHAANGETLETLVSAEVIEMGGEPLIISSMLDVTEIKNMTEQLQQAQKMELVGSLAGGVAHDFNNLLTIITGYSALALSRDLSPELAEEIRRIKEASGKAAELTRQLLAFSRRQVLQPRNISLNGVVTAVENLLHRTIGENITLVASLAPKLGTVYADPMQMEQVVMNLALNARDAMPHGGKLHFETKNLDLASAYPEKGIEIPPGRYVMLTVTDTGLGIKPEHLDRIFEPFFTTKEIGSGTGLGLSTAYGIIKQSGGYIWAYSEVGVGTTFTVCMPRVHSNAEAIVPSEGEPENLAGTETVLVVDDDPRVCELAAKVLAGYGYHVMMANSGEQARRCAAEHRGEIHALLTDVVMPTMSGRELARQLVISRPTMRVLYMSGYPHFALSGADTGELRESFLRKPFAPSDLARLVRKVVAGLHSELEVGASMTS